MSNLQPVAVDVADILPGDKVVSLSPIDRWHNPMPTAIRNAATGNVAVVSATTHRSNGDVRLDFETKGKTRLYKEWRAHTKLAVLRVSHNVDNTLDTEHAEPQTGTNDNNGGTK